MVAEETGGWQQGLSKEVKRKSGELPTKYPKMITKLSLINKGESSRESKNMISTRERNFLGRGILISFIFVGDLLK